MKTNKFDLAKIISDFMFHQIENPEEKARVVYELKHSLTPHGFEKYIQYYFKNYHGYESYLNGRTYERDGGIDILGSKGMKRVVAQCKKISMKDISEDQIRSFVGGLYVFNEGLLKDKDTKLFYITTSKFTKAALKYGEQANIICIDFVKLYDLQEKYSLEDFKIDLFKIEPLEIDTCLEKEQLQIPTMNEGILVEHVTSNEVFEFLKQIRRDIKNTYVGKQLYDIAKNETLMMLSRHRPHNMDSLKKLREKCDYGESNKLEKYGGDFIKRLRYIA